MKRKGITLTEALVALFIGALGMISLLTLFPLGAMQMGQALKDSRAAQAAQEADGIMRWYWSKHEVPGASASSLSITTAMDRGDFDSAPVSAASFLNGTEQAPSYAVFVDPLGYNNSWQSPTAGPSTGLTQKKRLGYSTTYPNGLQWLPRRTFMVPTFSSTVPSLLTNPGWIERATILQDELEYAETRGAPASGVQVQRGAQYSWSWLLQRPRNSQRGLVNMQVVVYFKRSPTFFRGDYESVYGVTFTPGTTRLQINYSGSRPELVKGRWVMDATRIDAATSSPLRHANFYRVVSVNDETAGSLFVELETPIRRSDNGITPYNGELVVNKNVAEVFERPPLANPN